MIEVREVQGLAQASTENKLADLDMELGFPSVSSDVYSTPFYLSIFFFFSSTGLNCYAYSNRLLWERLVISHLTAGIQNSKYPFEQLEQKGQSEGFSQFLGEYLDAIHDHYFLMLLNIAVFSNSDYTVQW